MISRFLGALQFLTIVPVPWRTAPAGQSAVFFPVVGAIIGVAAAWILQRSFDWFPPQIAGLLTLGFLVWITGSLHEDGLADCADAFRAGRTRGRILSILKDSRIGSYGAVALIVSLALRWQALVHLSYEPYAALVVSQAVPRAAMAGLAWIARPCGSGLGWYFSATLSTPNALAAIVLGALPLALLAPRLALLIAGITLWFTWRSRGYFESRLGGITGDCLGCTAQILECAILLLLACRYCTW